MYWLGNRKSIFCLDKPVCNSRVHGGASRKNSVGVQVLPDIDVALHDGVVGGLVDATGLHAQERGLEQGLRTPLGKGKQINLT